MKEFCVVPPDGMSFCHEGIRRGIGFVFWKGCEHEFQNGCKKGTLVDSFPINPCCLNEIMLGPSIIIFFVFAVLQGSLDVGKVCGTLVNPGSEVEHEIVAVFVEGKVSGNVMLLNIVVELLSSCIHYSNCEVGACIAVVLNLTEKGFCTPHNFLLSHSRVHGWTFMWGSISM